MCPDELATERINTLDSGVCLTLCQTRVKIGACAACGCRCSTWKTYFQRNSTGDGNAP